MSNVLVTINVTKEDIEQGTRSVPSSCMVNLALRRVLKKELGDRLFVGVFGASFGSTYLSFPTRVSDKIANWDFGKTVRPFTFTLSIPKTWVRSTRTEKIEPLPKEQVKRIKS